MLLNMMGMKWATPKLTVEVLLCWSRKGLPKQLKKTWNTIPAAIWWYIWKETRGVLKIRGAQPGELLHPNDFFLV